LLEELEEVPESVIDLLRLSRGALEMFESTQKRLVHELLADAELAQRVVRLMTIPAVGEITALTWALEVGDPERFSLQLRRHKLLRIDGCMEVFGGQVQQHTLGVCAFLHHIHMYDQIRTEVRHVLASCSLADPELQGAQS
jgi:hypothetical protein